MYLFHVLSFPFIVRKQEMRSNFNQLLLTVVVLDIALEAMSIWDTCSYYLELRPVLYLMIYPYFWYPVKTILLTFSTFLTMSIATERYLAVCRYNPLKRFVQGHRGR